MYVYLCYLDIICRTTPMGVVINSQISNSPMSQIKFSNNDFVTMYFKIESLSVSLYIVSHV